MMWMMYTGLAVAQADEVDCSEGAVEAATIQIVQMRGDDAAQAFRDLAKCDATVANKFVSTTVPTFVPNALGFAAAADAVLTGGEQDVMKWYATLETSEQKGLLRELGNRCRKEEGIQTLFLNVANNGTQQFWKSRFHQYITDCRIEPIQTLLTNQFEKGVEQGRSQYFSVMSSMARNLEGEALPLLKGALDLAEDGEVQVNLVASLYEAVLESNENHADDKKLVRDVTLGGIDAVFSNADRLQPEALLQARMVLTSLEAEQEADELAGYMYKSHRQPEGEYIWGLVVVENATCKNGKEKQRIYTSSIVEPGINWADQLSEKIEDVVSVQWEMDLAKRCKGAGDVQYVISETPIANPDALEVWQTEQRTAHTNANVKKVILLNKDPLKI